MMRYTIYEGEKETVAIQDEITYLQNSIELQKIRYKKSVDISFQKDIMIHFCHSKVFLMFSFRIRSASDEQN